MRLSDPHLGCRWVRDRLPLLVGGELVGSERRRTERHLIACADCRRERAALADSLGALHSASATPISTGPSLWPALERQIRESRHESRHPVLSFSVHFHDLVARLEAGLRFRPSPALLTLAVAGLTTLGVGLWARSQTDAANAQSLVAAQPIEPDFGEGYRPMPVVVTPVPLEPSPASNVAQTEPAPASRVDYDLDHGTPMGSDTRAVKSSY